MKSLALALIFIASANCGAEVLATVGGAKITSDDFNRRFQEVRKQTVNPPSPEQFLEDLVRFEVGVQEAEKMRLQNDPDVRDRFRQVLYNALLEKQIGKRVEEVKISDREMREYYKKNPEVHIAHILIELKPGAKPDERDAVKKRAAEILSEMKKSKRPFEDEVRLYSDDVQTKESGGDIGFQSRLTIVPTLYDTAINMKSGEIRGLVETPFGFHIIKLLEKRSYDLADKRQIRAVILDERRGHIFNDYFEKLKKQYKIVVVPGALKTGRR